MNNVLAAKSFVLSKNHYLIIGCVLILVYYVPFFIFGENTYVHIHDILDIDVAHIKMLLDQNAIFDYNKILPILDGLPRSEFFICFSPYDFKMLLYSILPTFWGYLINSILVRLSAFLGMFLLLSFYTLKGENAKYSNLIAFISAIIYAIIPFYTTFGLSSAGIPLLVWAFLNLKNKQYLIISYTCIIWFANYSCLVLSGVFVCIVFGFYYCYIDLKNKERYWHLLLGVVLLGIVYLVTNYDLLVHVFFNNDYISHRTEWRLSNNHWKIGVLDLLFNTPYHSGFLSTKGILFIIAISMLCQLRIDTRLLNIFIAVGAICCIFVIRVFILDLMPCIQGFQFDRFYFFLPMLWIVALAISLEIITTKINLLLALFLVFPIFVSQYENNDELTSIVHQLKGEQPHHPTYQQFYDEQLFSQITKELNVVPNRTKVVSIGLFPAIAEYNGYHTLDTYINMYPLEYKHKFRDIISAELEKNEAIKTYFDNWGNRCYMFSSEIEEANVNSYMISKHDALSISPEYNIEKLKELGANYIFSAVLLDNFEHLGLQYKGTFTTDKSFWQIYVYEIDSASIDV